MNNVRIMLMTSFLFVSSVCNANPDSEWLIIPAVSVGKITSKTSQEDLKSIYGNENVLEKEIHIGEGFMEPGTVLFPEEPKKILEITWHNSDRRTPKSIRINRTSTTWKTKQGVSIGSELKEIEKLNGRSFILTGFGWDYSGSIFEYNNGALKEYEENGLIIRLSPNSELQQDPEYMKVIGDGEFQSNIPAMQKLNPAVYQIIMIFNEM